MSVLLSLLNEGTITSSTGKILNAENDNYYESNLVSLEMLNKKYNFE